MPIRRPSTWSRGMGFRICCLLRLWHSWASPAQRTAMSVIPTANWEPCATKGRCSLRDPAGSKREIYAIFLFLKQSNITNLPFYFLSNFPFSWVNEVLGCKDAALPLLFHEIASYQETMELQGSTIQLNIGDGGLIGWLLDLNAAVLAFTWE